MENELLNSNCLLYLTNVYLCFARSSLFISRKTHSTHWQLIKKQNPIRFFAQSSNSLSVCCGSARSRRLSDARREGGTFVDLLICCWGPFGCMTHAWHPTWSGFCPSDPVVGPAPSGSPATCGSEPRWSGLSHSRAGGHLKTLLQKTK